MAGPATTLANDMRAKQEQIAAAAAETERLRQEERRAEAATLEATPEAIRHQRLYEIMRKRDESTEPRRHRRPKPPQPHCIIIQHASKRPAAKSLWRIQK